MIKITQIGDNIVFQGHTVTEVCASASSIMYTSVNMLNKYAKRDVDFTYDDNVDADFVTIKILKHDKIIDMIVENMFEMLNDLREENNYNKLEISRHKI